jgi:uncharacterized protein
MEQAIDRLSLIKSMKLMPIMGKHFIYDPATTFCAEIDEKAWEILSGYQRTANGQAPSDVAGSLKNDFPHELVDTVLEEWQSLAETQRLDGPENTKYPDSSLDDGFKSLILSLVHGCNLRCSYCFASHGTYGKDVLSMPKETARRAIDFYIENSSQGDLSISFFGGEALLDAPMLFHASEYALKRAKDLGRKLKLHVTTNGTLINEEVADFLIEHDFSLIVSLDGPAHLHNECRSYANGKGSHDVILKNLERIRNTEVSAKTTLRATFTADRIALKERVLYLDELVGRGYGGNCSVEPVSLPPDSPLALDAAALRKLAKEYEELAPIYLARARENNPIKFFHFDTFLKRIIDGSRSIRECGAGIGMIVVNPVGEIHACHHEGHALMGTLDDGIDRALQDQWRDNDMWHRRPCPECWARYYCGGGCRHEAIAYYNDPTHPDPASCGFKKALIRTGLWLASEMEKSDWEKILNGKGSASAAEDSSKGPNHGGDHDDNCKA